MSQVNILQTEQTSPIVADLQAELRANLGYQKMESIEKLRQHFAVKDTKAFHSLVKIMRELFEKDVKKNQYKEEEKIEAVYTLFLYSYLYGNMDIGKQAMEILFSYMYSPVYQKFYANLMLNVAFYTLPITTVIKNNLRQRLFKDLNNLNPFIFRDFVTNDYIVGSRIMNLQKNKGSDYEIYVYSNEGDLIKNFALKYNFTHKRFSRIGATEGVEDVRIINIPKSRGEQFIHLNELTKNDSYQEDIFLAIGTTMNTHAEGMIRMSIFYIHATRDANHHIIGLTGKNLIPLRGFEDNKRQKNWLPFFQNENLFFIYNYDPIIILEAKTHDEKNNVRREDHKENSTDNILNLSGIVVNIKEQNLNQNISEKKQSNKTTKTKLNNPILEKAPETIPLLQLGQSDKPNALRLGKMRGSVPPVLYKNEKEEENWLFITHYSESKHKIYYHRFIEMNKNFEITRISRVFYFERCASIEFAINMIFHTQKNFKGENENGLLISYGLRDKVSRVSFLTFYDLEKSFLPLNNYLPHNLQ